MKQVFLSVPDDKYNFFMELLNNLGIEGYDVFEEQKQIVRQRIKNSQDGNLIEWKDARKKLRFKK